MKRFIAAVTLGALLLMPASAFAYRGGHHHGDAVAWGVLGGIVGGVVLDRVLFPPPVVVAPPAYAPYPYYSRPYYPEPYGAVYVRGGYGYYRGGGRHGCREHRYRGGYRY